MPLSHVMITGVAGFVGSHLARACLQRGVAVTGLDNLERGSQRRLAALSTESNFTFVYGDIRDASTLEACLTAETVVFHEAALIDVNESLQHPTRYFQTNVEGFQILLETCRRRDVPRLVFASSCAIYGHQSPGPITESATPDPLSPYAVTKLEGEQLCQTYAERDGISTIVLRYFNIYGPGQTASYGGVITRFLEQVHRNAPLTIFGDGLQTRDFIQIDDIVAANLLAGHASQLDHAVLNIGTGIGTTINELATRISTLIRDTPPTIQNLPERPGDIRFSHADITQARHLLHFQPQCPLKQGLTRLLKDPPD